MSPKQRDVHTARKPKALILLSGAGVYDGSEIHEATLLLLALSRAGFEVMATAPNIAQHHVTDHFQHSQEEQESRNALVEAARIARGAIVPADSLSDLYLHSLQALVLPGGFGAATTLSNYASHTANFPISVEGETKRIISQFLDKRIPCLATCIAPVLIASVAHELGLKITMTLGMDKKEKEWLSKQGMDGVLATSLEAVVDHKCHVITTPAYMNPASISEIWIGIETAVNELKKITQLPQR